MGNSELVTLMSLFNKTIIFTLFSVLAILITFVSIVFSKWASHVLSGDSVEVAFI